MLRCLALTWALCPVWAPLCTAVPPVPTLPAPLLGILPEFLQNKNQFVLKEKQQDRMKCLQEVIHFETCMILSLRLNFFLCRDSFLESHLNLSMI